MVNRLHNDYDSVRSHWLGLETRRQSPACSSHPRLRSLTRIAFVRIMVALSTFLGASLIGGTARKHRGQQARRRPDTETNRSNTFIFLSPLTWPLHITSKLRCSWIIPYPVALAYIRLLGAKATVRGLSQCAHVGCILGDACP